MRAVAIGTALVLLLAGSFSSQTYIAMLDHGRRLWRIFAWQTGAWAFWEETRS